MFVDFRAVFDTLNRGMLGRAMRERKIKKELVVRVKETLRETRRVKTRGKTEESFSMARKVRQGCLLSPILFNLFIADLEEEMRRVKWSGINLREKRVFILLLVYADDIVLMAEEEDEMKSTVG